MSTNTKDATKGNTEPTSKPRAAATSTGSTTGKQLGTGTPTPTKDEPRPPRTRAEREAFVRQIARAKGMNEDELVGAVILNDDDTEDVDGTGTHRATRAKRSKNATVAVKIPSRIAAACAEHGITPAAFLRAITEDALENPATARDLMRELFPHPPATQ